MPKEEDIRRNIFVWEHGLCIKNKAFVIAPIELLDKHLIKRNHCHFVTEIKWPLIFLLSPYLRIQACLIFLILITQLFMGGECYGSNDLPGK